MLFFCVTLYCRGVSFFWSSSLVGMVKEGLGVGLGLGCEPGFGPVMQAVRRMLKRIRGFFMVVTLYHVIIFAYEKITPPITLIAYCL